MSSLNNECFSVGATVTCTDCFNKPFKGEVVSYEQKSGMLLLRCPLNDNSDEELYKVHILNLNMCRDILVHDDHSGAAVDTNRANFNVAQVSQPASLPLQAQSNKIPNALLHAKCGSQTNGATFSEQVKYRRAKMLTNRDMFLHTVNDAASQEAQALFNTLAKRLNHRNVSWDGQNIQIFDNEVTISPPYGVDDIRYTDSRTLEFVEKIVKQHNGVQSQTQTSREPQTPTNVSVVQHATRHAASPAPKLSSPPSSSSSAAVAPTAVAALIESAATTITNASGRTAAEARPPTTSNVATSTTPSPSPSSSSASAASTVTGGSSATVSAN